MINRGDLLRCPVFLTEYVAIQNSNGWSVRVEEVETKKKIYLKRGEFEKMPSKHFIDESPFQGWLEFDTPDGFMRAEYSGFGTWAMYSKHQGGYLRICTVQASKDASCKSLWDKTL
jgi:hypothetical protein